MDVFVFDWLLMFIGRAVVACSIRLSGFLNVLLADYFESGLQKCQGNRIILSSL